MLLLSAWKEGTDSLATSEGPTAHRRLLILGADQLRLTVVVSCCAAHAFMRCGLGRISPRFYKIFFILFQYIEKSTSITCITASKGIMNLYFILENVTGVTQTRLHAFACFCVRRCKATSKTPDSNRLGPRRTADNKLALLVHILLGVDRGDISSLQRCFRRAAPS